MQMNYDYFCTLTMKSRRKDFTDLYIICDELNYFDMSLFAPLGTNA